MAAEKQFEIKVKKFLDQNRIWYVKTWSNGVQRSGIPDILACVNGYFVGIELKAPKGKPSELQIYNLKKIHESGGFSFLLYPDDFDDSTIISPFKRFIEALKNDDYMTAVEVENMLLLKHEIYF